MTPENILDTVAAFHGIPVDRMTGPSRTRALCLARSEAATLLRERCPWLTLQDIAALLGRTDHSTMVNAIQGLQAMHRKHPAMKDRLEWLRYHLDREPAPTDQ